MNSCTLFFALRLGLEQSSTVAGGSRLIDAGISANVAGGPRLVEALGRRRLAPVAQTRRSRRASRPPRPRLPAAPGWLMPGSTPPRSPRRRADSRLDRGAVRRRLAWPTSRMRPSREPHHCRSHPFRTFRRVHLRSPHSLTDITAATPNQSPQLTAGCGDARRALHREHRARRAARTPLVARPPQAGR